MCNGLHTSEITNVIQACGVMWRKLSRKRMHGAPLQWSCSCWVLPAQGHPRVSLINNIRTFETLVSSVVNWSNSIIYIHENIGRLLLCRKVRSSPYRIHCISQTSVHYLKILDISSCWGLHLTLIVSYIYPFIKDNLYKQVFMELPYQGLSL